MLKLKPTDSCSPSSILNHRIIMWIWDKEERDLNSDQQSWPSMHSQDKDRCWVSDTLDLVQQLSSNLNLPRNQLRFIPSILLSDLRLKDKQYYFGQHRLVVYGPRGRGRGNPAMAASAVAYSLRLLPDVLPLLPSPCPVPVGARLQPLLPLWSARFFPISPLSHFYTWKPVWI